MVEAFRFFDVQFRADGNGNYYNVTEIRSRAAWRRQAQAQMRMTERGWSSGQTDQASPLSCS